MNYRTLIAWLDKKNLLDFVNDNYSKFIPFLTKCVKLKNEKMLIAGDLGLPQKRIAPILLGCYVKAAKELGLKYSIALQNPRFTKSRAGDEIIKSLSKLPPKSALAFALSGKVGSLGEIGKSYRRFAKRYQHKFLSTPGMADLLTTQFPDFMKSIDIDYIDMKEKAEYLNRLMTKASRIRIKTKAGTDLIFNVKDMKAISNDGYVEPNKLGGNLPAGEVYIPPNGKGVDGRVVIDGSCKYNGDTKLMIKEKVILQVENGSIIKISGKETAKKLEENLDKAYKRAKYPWGIRRIGELGIGINPGAHLIGPTLVNEKTLGTAHVAIGSNYWFGGSIYAIIHMDQVFKDPIIYIDGKRISVS